MAYQFHVCFNVLLLCKIGIYFFKCTLAIYIKDFADSFFQGDVTDIFLLTLRTSSMFHLFMEFRNQEYHFHLVIFYLLMIFFSPCFGFCDN